MMILAVFSSESAAAITAIELPAEGGSTLRFFADRRDSQCLMVPHPRQPRTGLINDPQQYHKN